MLSSETSDTRQIARLIARDVALSAKILQLVNSSFFGLGRRVSSIEQTVSLLGVIRLKALVLTEGILRQFVPPASLPEFSSGDLWAHSTRVAELARLISRAEGQTDDRPDQAFTAGLLHDLGKLIFAAQFTDEYANVLRSIPQAQKPAHEVALSIMGVTHAEVGAYLLGLWALPPRIIEAVAFHHQPGRIAYDSLCAVTAVHVADVLSYESQTDAPAGASPQIDLEYLTRINVVSRLPTWQELARKVSAPAQSELAPA
jgi:putative nucleotidyltransferase with HDIG domain